MGADREVFRRLRKAIDFGWYLYRFARIDPLMKSLQREPRFETMMQEVEERVEAMRERASGN